ncbi:MAG: glycerol kinase GlpK [Negativibacillus sp.]|nr:glycerol kinase GlpK [Negativibacillus sp.]
MAQYLLALDQGTTSSRAILFDDQQNIVGISQKEFTQHYPRQGWVEQDPMEIYSSQYGVMMEVIAKSGVEVRDIRGIGITNQRETTIIWDAKTGRPVYPAIVWQCRRTADMVDRLKEQGLGDYIRETTGLVPDAYFSATKIAWILDRVPDGRQRAKAGELLFGTVDSWLIWKLTGGAVHVTDYTNASRTMLFNIHTLDWDERLLEIFDVPREMLPQVHNSSEIYGYTTIQGESIPIAGIAGDQQAALFGQCCFEAGQAKNTYGTGCFLLMNTGDKPCMSQNGLITTIAIGLNGQVQYALEGSVFVGGAVIQWLRDEMRFITESKDAEYYAQKVENTGGVYLVPAFTGLGAPHWDMYARGCLIGLTRGTRREHIIRAAQESIAYQSYDLVKAMEKDTGSELSELKVDGGASRDAFLMQFQADILGCEVHRPMIRETTALGAAYLAGLAVGVWKDQEEIRRLWNCDVTFRSKMEEEEREKLLRGWHKAVGRSLNWSEE